MIFKGPFQLKLFCDSMASAKRTHVLKTNTLQICLAHSYNICNATFDAEKCCFHTVGNICNSKER